LKQLSQLAPKTPEADASEVKKSPNLPIRRA
jgi:hypothetical protein